LVLFVAGHDDLEVEVWQTSEKIGFGLVEARPDRRDQRSQVVFDAATGRSQMRGANRVFAGQPDEVVFVVVGRR
jgi:hypothetical protein